MECWRTGVQADLKPNKTLGKILFTLIYKITFLHHQLIHPVAIVVLYFQGPYKL